MMMMSVLARSYLDVLQRCVELVLVTGDNDDVGASGREELCDCLSCALRAAGDDDGLSRQLISEILHQAKLQSHLAIHGKLALAREHFAQQQDGRQRTDERQKEDAQLRVVHRGCNEEKKDGYLQKLTDIEWQVIGREQRRESISYQFGKQEVVPRVCIEAR
jgi:hypothetical protein